MGKPSKVKVKTDPTKIPCGGGCGKTADLSYQVRIAARLGMKPKLSYQCSDCYKKEHQQHSIIPIPTR